MKKIILISIITIFFNIQGYSQTENIVDLMMQSYIQLYDLSESEYEEIENSDILCPEKSDIFYNDFNTLKHNFVHYDCDSGGYYSFEIKINNNNARPPIKPYLQETSEPFKPRTLEGKEERCHGGIDLKLPNKGENDTIYSILCGAVRYISDGKSGFGHYLIVRGYNGMEILYAHLSQLPLVKINEEVKAGDPIGLGGNTGNSTGPHLHLEVNFERKPVNPYYVLDKLGLKRKR